MASGGGWVCQKCGRSYGPNVLECRPCNLLIERGPLISSGTDSLSYCMKCGAMANSGQTHQCKVIHGGSNRIS